MDEYISKHDAYITLKDLEAAYIYPPVKEAYATAARRIDEIKAADVQPVKCCRMIPLEPDSRGYTDVFICTNCHQHIHLGFIRKEYSGSYCLECGAEVKDGDAE